MALVILHNDSCLWSDQHLNGLNRPGLMQHSCSKD